MRENHRIVEIRLNMVVNFKMKGLITCQSWAHSPNNCWTSVALGLPWNPIDKAKASPRVIILQPLSSNTCLKTPRGSTLNAVSSSPDSWDSECSGVLPETSPRTGRFLSRPSGCSASCALRVGRFSTRGTGC